MTELLAEILFGGTGEDRIEESEELHRIMDRLMEMFAEPTHAPDPRALEGSGE